MINRSLSNRDLGEYIARQLNNYFPDQGLPSKTSSSLITGKLLTDLISGAEERVFGCFGNLHKKYFNDGNAIHFNHLMSDQYCMYLYMLANHIHKTVGEPEICTKLYYLNKALHGVDIFYTHELPEVFLFVHPMGSILGPADYSDYLVVYQSCTVGCLNDAQFPTFRGKTVLYSNSSILGSCTIGDNVCVAAGTSIVNQDIPDNSVVIGHSDGLQIKNNDKDVLERPPFKYQNRNGN